MYYTVGEIEKLTGVTMAMLHDYDKKGLLCPMRTGEGVANNRRLYSEDDIERLKKIVVLRSYDFSLKEIGRILDDDEADIFEILDDKIIELRREENRIRNLILFAKFVQVTGVELFEGLANGPSDIDAFADAVRDSPLYKAGLGRIKRYSEGELAAIFDELDAIVDDFMMLSEEDGFAGVERQIDLFCAWWDKNVAPMSECGYLGFWAIFEDDAVVASEVEAVGGQLASGSLQMSAFYVWMKRMMIDFASQITELANQASSDVVAAMVEAQNLLEVLCERMGIFSHEGEQTDVENAFLIDLGGSLFGYMDEILGDEELMGYIDAKGEIALDCESIATVRNIVKLMAPEDDAGGDKGSDSCGDA